MSPERTILHTLDVAYDLESATISEWLTRVVHAVRPLFAPHLGSYGWLLDVGASGATVREVATLGFSTEQERAIGEVHRRAPKQLIDRAYGPTPITTVSDAMGGLATFQRSPLVKRYMHDNGIPDTVALRIRAGSTVLVLGGVMPEPGHVPEVVRRYGQKLFDQLGPAFRMQHAFESTSERPRPEAVLTPDGRVLHAERAATTKSARRKLAEAVRSHERLRGRRQREDPAEALELFEGLVAGRWTLLERFESDGRRYLVAYENTKEAAARRALSPRERDVLWRVGMGVPVKRIAADLGISTGAAGAYLASARRKTGLSSRLELARWFSGALARHAASASTERASPPIERGRELDA